MRRRRIWLAMTLILIPALPFAALGILYQHGAAQIQFAPKPTQTPYPDEIRRLYWRSLGGGAEIRMRRFNAATYLKAQYFNQGRAADATLVMQISRYGGCANPAAPDSQPARHLTRHLAEFACAIRISNEWSPEQILDTGLDVPWFGRDAKGLHAAAPAYYGQDVNALAPPQVLALLTLTFAPSSLNPDCHPERFAQRYHRTVRHAGFDETDMPLHAAMQGMQLRPCPVRPTP